ncbi:hypothetical protein Pcinc_034908 [Petrolisthes cinctipes]|uniref:Uncharacterized protein n=1 Tax=Petrolisthes cinctipes TaxID=88211 RepID=A0AAE1BYZ7_PETCI|nr:hypothetical protein Pcinc_034908 [Petrolisthes cinctipes]
MGTSLHHTFLTPWTHGPSLPFHHHHQAARGMAAAADNNGRPNHYERLSSNNNIARLAHHPHPLHPPLAPGMMTTYNRREHNNPRHRLISNNNNNIIMSHHDPQRQQQQIRKSAENVPMEVVQLVGSAVQGVYSHYTTTTTTTTTPRPPVIWFPNLSTECVDDAGGGVKGSSSSGFSTFSFLAMVVSVANLVSLIASNANNNINNNNDNNNINSDSVQAGNEDNNNNNLNLLTMIQFAGRRRRRHSSPVTATTPPHPPDTSEDVPASVGFLFLQAWLKGTQQEGTSSFTPRFTFNTSPLYSSSSLHPLYFPSSPVSTFNVSLSPSLSHYSNLRLSTPESFVNLLSSPITPSKLSTSSSSFQPVGAVEGLQKVKEGVGAAVERLQKGEGSVGAANCLQKLVCEANHESSRLGILGEDLAEVLSVSLVEALLEGRQERWRATLLRAGGRGRAGWDCDATYHCHDH